MTKFTLTTVLCVVALTASSSDAFTVGPQFQKSAAANHYAARRTRTAPSSSNVILHANLFDRFARVAKSNLNNLAGKLEDPEKIMEQALEEMQVSSISISNQVSRQKKEETRKLN
jgi:hypothetical protein